MAQFNWFGGSGDLGTPTNWLNQPNPDTPVDPGAMDQADFSGSGTLTGSLTALDVYESGSFVLNGVIDSVAYAGINGALTVQDTGASFTGSAVLGVGGTTAGMLSILNGGSVTSDGMTIEGLGGVMSDVTVDGQGSLLTDTSYLNVGNAGDATLSVGGGGGVTIADGIGIGNQSGSMGSVSIAGTGSTMAVTGYLTLGYAGLGVLSVSAGGVVSEMSSGFGIFIANQPGSVGLATVDGAGSTLSDVSYLDVGGGGFGSLMVTNGAVVKAGAGVAVGDGAGATGAITIDGSGSALTVVGNINVGNGGSGSLTIRNGGVTTVNGFFSIGSQAGAVGTVAVSSDGSMTTNSIGVGNLGNGALVISSGGALTTGFMDVGQNVGAEGTATVAGSGSTATANAGLNVGDGGTGTLSVLAGATVSATGMDLGYQAGASGTVIVDGSGASVTDSAYLTVGDMGDASITISNGGACRLSTVADGVTLGNKAGANGSVTVEGPGSVLTDAGSFEVGGAGAGVLTVANGAAALARGVTLAGQSGSPAPPASTARGPP